MNEAGRPDVDRLIAAQEERERIRLAFPLEFADGVERAFAENRLYPSGFSSWPLDKRNAWFAGYNLGYCHRLRALAELEGGDGR
jgi:hypothetical protein